MRIKAWSYSRLNVYSKCPKMFKFKFIDKLPEPPSPAMERGNQIHKKAEAYAKGELSRVPTELKLFAPQFRELKKKKQAFAVEENWAFTKDFKQVTQWDNWNGAWCRVKIDLVLHDKKSDNYTVIDHKTGKVRHEEHAEQLELSALATFLSVPTADKITVENWYIDHGPGYTQPHDFERKQAASLKKKWIAKVKPMMSDVKFNERPGSYCRWCAFSKSRGGQCKFGG